VRFDGRAVTRAVGQVFNTEVIHNFGSADALGQFVKRSTYYLIKQGRAALPTRSIDRTD